MICVTENELNVIVDIIKKYIPNCEVRAFGSRYKGNPKIYSDLDLAIVGKERLGIALLGKVKEAFQESDLNFRVDVLDWSAISEEFKKIIEQSYEVVYPNSNLPL